MLIRAVSRGDAEQARRTVDTLTNAAVIAVASPCLCEFARVLRKVDGLATEDTATRSERWLAPGNVLLDRPALEAGPAVLDAGGDFDEGVIASGGTGSVATPPSRLTSGR